MTNLTSYTFSFNREDLPHHLMEEPELALHLTVSDDRIVVRLDRVLTDDAGVVSERLAEERVITLHVNASGEKYLRAFQTDSFGREREWAFDVSRNWILNNLGMPYEAKLIINESICTWLESNITDYIARENGPWAFYPALRTLPIWKEEAGISDWEFERKVLHLMSPLSIAEGRSGRLRDALRSNSDWDSFICEIIKETTDSTESVALIANSIADDPNLLEFAVLETGMPFVKLFQDNGAAVKAYAASFRPFDKHAIHLMLDHLPEEMKPDATQIILFMINDRKKGLRNPPKALQRDSDASDRFARVPDELKGDLALELYNSLNTNNTEYDEASTRFIPTMLEEAYHDWFYEFVFQPSIVSDASIANVSELHEELFGVECSELKFYETDKRTTFCQLDSDQEDPLVFAHLAPLIHAFPESKENSLSYNEYVDAEGYSGVMPQGAIYSPDDIVAVLKLGADAVDCALVSLGREITPENRFAYLTVPARERDLKSTWQYYDLGVTEPSKIHSLKKSGLAVTDVDEIVTYAQLPDEMFYEIIGLRTQ